MPAYDAEAFGADRADSGDGRRGSVVGAALAATVRILDGGLYDVTDLDQVDEALKLLEKGLPLAPPGAHDVR